MGAADLIRLDGKFFRCGADKFFVKAVSYGPFAPDESGCFFPSVEQTTRDFALIRELGGNVVRVYYVPPRWFLDLAAEQGLKVFIDIPWPKHMCFLDSRELQQEARSAVREGVAKCRGHPAVFAYSVVNEIPAEIVRWSGPQQVERFIDELISIAKSVDPCALYTFTSFPPTEFLAPRLPDFLTFNIYLHDPKVLANYLGRLQMLADDKPLLLGEFGIDSMREGEDHKSEVLARTIETAFRAGLAGTVVFSFTDDWFRGGFQIEDWAFGLTSRTREKKKSYFAVQKGFQTAPYFPLPSCPRLSVVVASYNGARTLAACLDSLFALNYPDYEVILVDDGSTDETPEIAKNYPRVRYVPQANEGLSAARNAGIRAATGAIVAFTDSDCRADPDWLYYLVADLLKLGHPYVGIGGHNFLPPDDSPIAAAVLAAPGGPAHVMLTDQEAEHIPGCNMAFFKWALDEINGFDSIYAKAGDDVDVCWRLQDRGYKLGFSPAGFVWHYRRSTVKAYLKQQAGYGEAEAFLIQKHPERFNRFGGSLWKGRIYATSRAGIVLRAPIIYHGVFATGLFQSLYASEPALPLMLCTSLAYHCFVSLPLLLASVYVPALLPLGIAAPAASALIAAWVAAQARVPDGKRRFWSKPLIACMFFLQPIVRGWTRVHSRFFMRVKPVSSKFPLYVVPADPALLTTSEFWTQQGADRCEFLKRLIETLQKQCSVRVDSGWSKHDLEVASGGWNRLRVSTVTEDLAQQRRLYRCRLEPAWTWRAKLIFIALIALVSLLIESFAAAWPWTWMLLTTLPLLYWFYADDQTELIQHVSGVAQAAAQECGWVKLEKPGTITQQRPEPVADKAPPELPARSEVC